MATVVKKIKINKRCKKLKNKIYRRYGDIWGRLALKKRDNFITSLVHNFERQAFGRKRDKNKKPPNIGMFFFYFFFNF